MTKQQQLYLIQEPKQASFFKIKLMVPKSNTPCHSAIT